MLHVARAVTAHPTTPTNCLPTIITCAVFGGLSWIAVSLRIWTRLSIVKNLGWDDNVMVIATVFFSVYCSAVITISTKVTKDERIVSWDALMITVPLLTVAEVFYLLTLLALKISLGIFFLRIAIVVWHRRIIYAAVTVSTVWSIVMFWFAIFQCGTYHSSLEFIMKRISGKGCASEAATLGMAYSHAGVTTLTDWTFLLLPILILRGSLMGRSEKWTVGTILGFAAVSGIASLIRFKYINGLGIQTQTFFVTAKGVAIWSAIEPGVGIIAGSLVTLRPLARSLVATFRSRSTNYTPGQRAGRPYLGDSQSSTHLRDPEVPETVFLGFYKNELIHQIPDLELGPRNARHQRSRLDMKGLIGGLPLAFLKSSKTRSKTPESSEEDAAAEQWRQQEIIQARRAREEQERREKAWWRPSVPPKKDGGEWREPTPLKGEPAWRPSTAQPFRGVSDIWRPTTAPEVRMPRSGLPLNFFASDEPQPPETEKRRVDQQQQDSRSKEDRARRKPKPPKKKRGSGLPLNMFGTNNDSSSSRSSTSSF